MSETQGTPPMEMRRRRYLLIRRIVIGVAVGLGVLIVGTLLWMVWLNQEHVTEVSTLNPGGASGDVLVVYHPGGTDFHERATEAFAGALAERGYAVDLTTASSQAPATIDGYDLLVLGSPIYAGKPGRPLTAYVDRVGDFNGHPTVVVISGQGATDSAVEFMENRMSDSNAELLQLLVLWTSAPNEELYGISDPVEIMERQAEALDIPSGDA